MTQEEKQLLIRDICTRLPYGVMLSTPNGNKPLLALVSSKKYNTICVYDDYCGDEDDIREWEGGDIEFVKPYLRPLSTMTKEEEVEWFESVVPTMDCDKQLDFYCKYHFDYRGLIEKGLAVQAPKGMYC